MFVLSVLNHFVHMMSLRSKLLAEYVGKGLGNYMLCYCHPKIFSLLCIEFRDNFLDFFLFILGPRRQLFKTRYSTATTLFTRWPPCEFPAYRCSKSQLLLPIHFKLSTVIHITSGKNPIDFQWDHKNNMADTRCFI